MRHWKVYFFIAATLVVVFGALRVYQTLTSDLASARADLQRVQARAEAQLRLNARIRIYASQLEATADSAETRAIQATRRAAHAEGRLAAARTAPDSLPPAIARGDAYLEAYEAQKVASDSLRVRGDTLEAVNGNLAGIVRDYGDASVVILKATRPSFWKSLKPDVGVGVTVGIDPLSQRPAIATGLTLSWRIF